MVAKAFSVASWNVEHFRSMGTPSRVEDVVAFLAGFDPDVFALYEVEGKEVWRELLHGMPGHSFFITEGQNTQQILLGTKSGISAFVTQKVEFRARDAYMRPGALMTVRDAGHDYTLLFLHLASMQDPRGFGLRTDMVDRAFAFKTEVVDAIAGAEPNFLFVGDLNSMGLDYVYGKEATPAGKLLRDRADAAHEIARLQFEGAKHGMRVLTKSHDLSWRSQRLRSNLDHVVAAEHLRFLPVQGAEVAVRGWPELDSEPEQLAWIARFSDHALLYFEVEAIV